MPSSFGIAAIARPVLRTGRPFAADIRSSGLRATSALTRAQHPWLMDAARQKVVGEKEVLGKSRWLQLVDVRYTRNDKARAHPCDTQASGPHDVFDSIIAPLLDHLGVVLPMTRFLISGMYYLVTHTYHVRLVSQERTWQYCERCTRSTTCDVDGNQRHLSA